LDVTLTPETLADAVRRGDVRRVRTLLDGADEPARKACVPVVKAISKQLRETTLHSGSPAAAACARAGTYSGAAAVADALRRDHWEWRTAVSEVAGVLVDRQPRWLPDVVDRLAAVEHRDAFDDPWELLERLRRATGRPRPLTPSYLRGWANSLNGDWTSAPPDLPEMLRRDPEQRALVLPLLQVPEISLQLRGRDTVWRRRLESPGSEAIDASMEQTWPGALRVLVDEGVLDRAAVLDTVLDVLLRGGKREHVAFFARIHETLAVTQDELVDRLRTYGRLLQDGSGPIATSVQKRLRAADADGRLGRVSLLERL
jgi:hypothetical protein